MVAEDQAEASVPNIEGLLHDLVYAAATDSDLTEELLVMFVRILLANSGCYAEHDTFALDEFFGLCRLAAVPRRGLGCICGLVFRGMVNAAPVSELQRDYPKFSGWRFVG